jgi:hypothetical protein
MTKIETYASLSANIGADRLSMSRDLSEWRTDISLHRAERSADTPVASAEFATFYRGTHILW